MNVYFIDGDEIMKLISTLFCCHPYHIHHHPSLHVYLALLDMSTCQVGYE